MFATHLSAPGVRLEPLTMALLDEVCAAVLPDDNGWYAKMFGLNSKEAYADYLASVLVGARVAYAIRDEASGRIAGYSSFLNISDVDRQVEIGSTNIAPSFRRSRVNTAAKFAMLREAFELQNCVRVSFRIDQENQRSQRAVERIGAKLGGQLRAERILPDGRVRDYFFYTIIASEWAARETRGRKIGEFWFPA